MKHIKVVAAIICKDGKILATQRGYGEWKGWWEFPGGKMEADEAPDDALKREILEELSAPIDIDRFLLTSSLFVAIKWRVLKLSQLIILNG